MSKVLTTTEELKKYDGAKVTCVIEGTKIDDAEIFVDGEAVYALQNVKDGWGPKGLRGYNRSWRISSSKLYEETNRHCTDITLKEPTLKRGDKVWVSVKSEETARKGKRERIFLADVGGRRPYICIAEGEEHEYPDGAYSTVAWSYAIPVGDEKDTLEITVKLNGKEVPLSSISEETLLNLRKVSEEG